MPTDYPQELIDMVIDEVHDDIPALRALSLSFRAAVSSAQSHLFRKVVLTPPQASSGLDSDRLTPCRRLKQLLISSAHLALHLKDLQIIEDQTARGKWVLNSAQALSSILLRVNLKRITIQCAVEVNWHSVDRSLQTALQKTFNTPGLESIQLWGIRLPAPQQQFPLAHIFNATTASLTTLAVSFDDAERIPDNPPADDAVPPWLPKLQSLAIGTPRTGWDPSGSVARAFSSPALDFSRLRSLSISTPDSYHLLTAIHGRCALEDLNIWLGYGESHVSGVLALLPRLRSVRWTFESGLWDMETLRLIVEDCATTTIERLVLDVGDCVSDVSSWMDLAAAVARSGKATEIVFGTSFDELIAPGARAHFTAIQRATEGINSVDTKGLLTVIPLPVPRLTFQDICIL